MLNLQSNLERFDTMKFGKHVFWQVKFNVINCWPYIYKCIMNVFADSSIKWWRNMKGLF